MTKQLHVSTNEASSERDQARRGDAFLWRVKTTFRTHEEGFRCVAKSLRCTRSHFDVSRNLYAARGATSMCREISTLHAEPLRCVADFDRSARKRNFCACEFERRSRRKLAVHGASFGRAGASSEHPEALSRHWEFARCAVQWERFSQLA